MYKMIGIIGEAGAGKDTILKKVLEMGGGHLSPTISCTTRPPRDYEKDGVDYHFLTNEQFANYVLQNKFIEVSEFNNWFYGTLKDDLKTDYINISVLNPEGIENILLHNDIDLKVYYVEVPGRIRICRQLMREQDPDIPEIFRRYIADDEDFFDLPFEYTILKNETHKEFAQATDRIFIESFRWAKYGNKP